MQELCECGGFEPHPLHDDVELPTEPVATNKRAAVTGPETRAAIRRHVATVYLGGKCAECGTTDDLQFDHVDPAGKLFAIGDGLWQKPEIVFWEEIEKCQLLCREHHVAKTGEDIATGRTRVGAPRKLSDDQVAEAVWLHRRGASFVALGISFGVATSTVWSAIRKYEGEQERNRNPN